MKRCHTAVYREISDSDHQRRRRQERGRNGRMRGEARGMTGGEGMHIYMVKALQPLRGNSYLEEGKKEEEMLDKMPEPLHSMG